MSAVSRNGLRFMHARKAVQLIEKDVADVPADGPANVQQQKAWLAKMREALAVAKKEVGLAEQADADVSAQQKALDRAEKTVKDAEARWSTINDASTSAADTNGTAKRGAAAPAGGATAPNSSGGGNATDKDADADAEAETEAEEDELHDEDEHPSTGTAAKRRAGAAENGNSSAEDAKSNNKNEKSAAQRKGGRVGPGGTVKRIVHDPKCERCASSGKQCVGIEGRACQPCGLMKMKCSMSSKVGRQPNASTDAVSAPAPATTASAGTKSRAAAQRANGHTHVEPHNAASGSGSGSGAAGAASVSAGNKRTRDDDDALNILSATDPASASAAGVLTSLRSSSKRPRNNVNAHAHASTATAAEALKELKSSLSKDIKEANKNISSTAAVAKGKGRAALDDGAILRLVTPLLQMQSAMAEMSSELVKLIEKNKG